MIGLAALYLYRDAYVQTLWIQPEVNGDSDQAQSDEHTLPTSTDSKSSSASDLAHHSQGDRNSVMEESEISPLCDRTSVTDGETIEPQQTCSLDSPVMVNLRLTRHRLTATMRSLAVGSVSELVPEPQASMNYALRGTNLVRASLTVANPVRTKEGGNFAPSRGETPAPCPNLNGGGYVSPRIFQAKPHRPNSLSASIHRLVETAVESLSNGLLLILPDSSAPRLCPVVGMTGSRFDQFQQSRTWQSYRPIIPDLSSIITRLNQSKSDQTMSGNLSKASSSEDTNLETLEDLDLTVFDLLREYDSLARKQSPLSSKEADKLELILELAQYDEELSALIDKTDRAIADEIDFGALSEQENAPIDIQAGEGAMDCSDAGEGHKPSQRE